MIDAGSVLVPGIVPRSTYRERVKPRGEAFFTLHNTALVRRCPEGTALNHGLEDVVSFIECIAIRN